MVWWQSGQIGWAWSATACQQPTVRPTRPGDATMMIGSVGAAQPLRLGGGSPSARRGACLWQCSARTGSPALCTDPPAPPRPGTRLPNRLGVGSPAALARPQAGLRLGTGYSGSSPSAACPRLCGGPGPPAGARGLRPAGLRRVSWQGAVGY